MRLPPEITADTGSIPGFILDKLNVNLQILITTNITKMRHVGLKDA